jgi:hypothetical protein
MLPYSWFDQDCKREVLPDYLIRASSAPAGLAAPYLVYHTITKFASNPIWLCTPQLGRLLEIVKAVKKVITQAANSWREKVVDECVYYHIGATYLTGGERRTIAGTMPLGLIDSFLYHLHTLHTLTKSPLITGSGSHSNQLRYVNQEGFDEAYDQLCLGIRLEDARGMDVSALKFLRKELPSQP